MLSCSLFACAMFFLQGVRERADVRDQLQGRPTSADTTWIRAAEKKPAKHIRGHIWTRGLAVEKTDKRAVWIAGGPSGLGDTFGVGVTVDF